LAARLPLCLVAVLILLSLSCAPPKDPPPKIFRQLSDLMEAGTPIRWRISPPKP
jgi:hypothetical protein